MAYRLSPTSPAKVNDWAYATRVPLPEQAVVRRWLAYDLLDDPIACQGLGFYAPTLDPNDPVTHGCWVPGVDVLVTFAVLPRTDGDDVIDIYHVESPHDL